MLPEKWGHDHYYEKRFFKCSSKTGEQIDQSGILSLILLGYPSFYYLFPNFQNVIKKETTHPGK